MELRCKSYPINFKTTDLRNSRACGSVHWYQRLWETCCIHLPSCRSTQHVLPRCWYQSTKQYGITTQTTFVLTLATVTNSYLAHCIQLWILQSKLHSGKYCINLPKFCPQRTAWFLLRVLAFKPRALKVILFCSYKLKVYGSTRRST